MGIELLTVFQQHFYCLCDLETFIRALNTVDGRTLGGGDSELITGRYRVSFSYKLADIAPLSVFRLGARRLRYL
ncbi:hypothetical protein J6590_025058 [Homalodisca vitripennis]|nr:hypothetical protein J6590_025058 [Homalodisca vitripennis]